jgi:hypothetical protein
MSASGSKNVNPAVAVIVIVVVLAVIALAYMQFGGMRRQEPNRENIMKHMPQGGKMSPMSPRANP